MSNTENEMAVETQDEVIQAPLTDAEKKLLDDEGEEHETEDDDEDDDPPEQEPEHEIPDWAVIPNGIKLPPVGTQIVFMRVPAAWTRDPAGGDLQCVLWPLEDHEELAAYQRARGDHPRSVIELAKGCIKIVNGEKADWSRGAATSNVTKFWKQCGAKARHMIRNYYAKQHMVSATEALDFFSKHFVAVTVQPAAK